MSTLDRRIIPFLRKVEQDVSQTRLGKEYVARYRAISEPLAQLITGRQDVRDALARYHAVEWLNQVAALVGDGAALGKGELNADRLTSDLLDLKLAVLRAAQDHFRGHDDIQALLEETFTYFEDELPQFLHLGLDYPRFLAKLQSMEP